MEISTISQLNANLRNTTLQIGSESFTHSSNMYLASTEEHVLNYSINTMNLWVMSEMTNNIIFSEVFYCLCLLYCALLRILTEI